MLVFDLEYRPDLTTYFYAELWASVPFFVKMGTGQTLPSEVKGDERKIGCVYKVDVTRAYWVGWEGTHEDGVPILWVAPAANDTPPAAHVKLIHAGVNIARWVEEENGDDGGDDGTGNGDNGTDDGEDEEDDGGPYIPDPDELPSTTTLVGYPDTTRVEVHFWSSEGKKGYQIIYEMPLSEYARVYEDAGLVTVLTWLRERIEAGEYTAEWHVRK